jgi:hypothetical protein
LEYHSGADRGYGHRFGSRYVHGDDYRCGWLYNDGRGYDHPACCCAVRQHHGYYERELLWRGNGLYYRDSYGWYGSVHV